MDSRANVECRGFRIGDEIPSLLDKLCNAKKPVCRESNGISTRANDSVCGVVEPLQAV